MLSYNRGLLCQNVCWSGKQQGISASIEFSSENSPKSKLMKITSVGSLAVRYANVNFPLPSLFPFSQREGDNSIYVSHLARFATRYVIHMATAKTLCYTFASRNVLPYGIPMSVFSLVCLMCDIRGRVELG